MSPKRRRDRTARRAEEARQRADREPSPAERFRAFREDQAEQGSHRASFADGLPFRPDAFQMDAMRAVEDGDAVLVAAPTGAGKTVVGEFATDLALSQGTRAFYTTPIKALSNQKFNDLVARFGESQVGLLTGDVSVNPDAPIVVMTTEVLRNMLYAGADLSALSHVVLDEVHYLADRFRGPVWEEVIIHLPLHVCVVALSATVSNAEEFGAWMREVRGACQVIVSEVRPVPLYQHMIAGGRLFDLYAAGGESRRKLNPELVAWIDRSHGGGGRGNQFDRRGRGGVAARGAGFRDRRPRREPRADVLITLDRAQLLPAIVFIFSRAGCEEAVRSILHTHLALTTPAEAKRIRKIADEATLTIPAADHAVLGLDTWKAALERGVAAHHAGLLPVMKETVERLFSMGLVKVVYATETLALGINMPARTVVLESLRKWNGVEHVQLSAGEYTQLTGRAGRRGIDVEGHAVVLHQGQIQPEEVASLASKRTYPLISAFHPTYNMAVNLLEHSDIPQVREVLETSFAQFQADEAVVGLARRSREVGRRVEELGERLTCSRGDAREYFELRERLNRAQKDARRRRSADGRRHAEQVLKQAKRGDVLAIRRGRREEVHVVVDPAGADFSNPTVRAVGVDARVRTLEAGDGVAGIGVVGHINLPTSAAVRKLSDRKDLAGRLRGRRSAGDLDRLDRGTKGSGNEIDELIRAVQNHPVHSCPHRDEHARVGVEWTKLKREYDELMVQIQSRTNSVAQEFDRVCAVLDDLGFLDAGRVTESGQRLRRVFGERDVIAVRAVESGAWDDLDPLELAAIVSTCVFESRPDTDADLEWMAHDDQPLARAWDGTLDAQTRVSRAETAHGARETPPIDPGLVSAIHAWASGSSLATALTFSDLQGGDFVRWVRQVMDMLDQLRRIERGDLPERARKARDAIRRGVVSWDL